MLRNLFTLVLSGVLAGSTVAVLAGTPGAYPATAGAAANWASHGGGVDESGYSRLDAVNSRNIDRLGLAWSMDLPGEVTLEATPLAVDGVLYFSGSYSGVYAVDGASGKLLWKYDPEIWRVAPAKQQPSPMLLSNQDSKRLGEVEKSFLLTSAVLVNQIL